ncbi:MAG: cupin domain-containing protein [Pseudomonadales bacterium]|nr:cupin domain-containing protein [Pseudomonadales bacterium]
MSLPTRCRADFSQREVVLPSEHQWFDSPQSGVRRMPLDRIGAEQARATSLVRYAPHSEFAEHQHPGGEEIFVLEGEFADEYGSYPAGSYLRNPIGSSHSPKVGAQGALIFVKLQQFQADDQLQLNLNCNQQAWRPGLVDGLSVMPLHDYEGEHIALVKWAAFTEFNPHQHFGGEEILVLEGTFYDEHGSYPKGSWIRSPHLSQHRPFTREDGALIYVKVGHLHPELIAEF